MTLSGAREEGRGAMEDPVVLDQRVLLCGQSLRCRLGGRTVVDDVSIDLAAGETTLLVGPNGSGKTTLLRLLAGSLPLSAGGQVWIDGEDVSRLPLYRRARLGLGYLPQGPSVFVGMTVRENLEVVFEQQRRSSAERQAKVDELIVLFGLSAVACQHAGKLSGGERRRVELARVVALGPRVVLLDEPFAGLDQGATRVLLDHVSSLAARGMAVLVAEHRVQQALTIARRGCILVQGRIVASGEPSEIARRYRLGDCTVDLDHGDPRSSEWHSK